MSSSWYRHKKMCDEEACGSDRRRRAIEVISLIPDSNLCRLFIFRLSQSLNGFLIPVDWSTTISWRGWRLLLLLFCCSLTSRAFATLPGGCCRCQALRVEFSYKEISASVPILFYDTLEAEADTKWMCFSTFFCLFLLSAREFRGKIRKMRKSPRGGRSDVANIDYAMKYHLGVSKWERKKLKNIARGKIHQRLMTEERKKMLNF